MSERERLRAPSGGPGTGHWGREIEESTRAEYVPIKPMHSYQEMKAEGGNKVEVEGILYFREARHRGSFLGVVVEQDGSSLPVLVQTGEGLPAIPHAASVRVDGRLADEPFANAG